MVFAEAPVDVRWNALYPSDIALAAMAVVPMVAAAVPDEVAARMPEITIYDPQPLAAGLPTLPLAAQPATYEEELQIALRMADVFYIG